MPDIDLTIAAIVAAAKAWQDPECTPRAEAAHATLSAPNRFTEEAVAFAINQHMHQLASPKKLRAWLGKKRTPRSAVPVGIVAQGTVPMESLRALTGVWLTGHIPVLLRSEASPHLLHAFAGTVASEGGPATTFAEDDAHLLAHSKALLVCGEEEITTDWVEKAQSANLEEPSCWIRTSKTTIAVIDGTEEFEERIGLAEDVLLHEGVSESNVALLWAPKGLNPDPYFEAFSGFRQVMPAHLDTEGVLEMSRAFLKAAGQPYAWGEGVLVSRGEPEKQSGGHLRWVEYEAPAVVLDWIKEHRDRLRSVVATERVADRFGLPDTLHVNPGDAHRARLGGAQDAQLMAFLRGLE